MGSGGRRYVKVLSEVNLFAMCLNAPLQDSSAIHCVPNVEVLASNESAGFTSLLLRMTNPDLNELKARLSCSSKQDEFVDKALNNVLDDSEPLKGDLSYAKPQQFDSVSQATSVIQGRSSHGPARNGIALRREVSG